MRNHAFSFSVTVRVLVFPPIHPYFLCVYSSCITRA